ncbi:uncharacterized protein LOC112348315 [Selaginella moellendorffii]|uniref:uncharacterized protein LOC112348315 n=1 Tax=Selaginella moellendorffii TaxID=88036 RepID=UPI000D1C45B9|nr:uncharacterized protein LOC112348315 [Selaginella moellendorffii]|eukprot:XP_024536374.1 uncharacterized protein LOC112348315 [Selaginella moellendorffii]
MKFFLSGSSAVAIPGTGPFFQLCQQVLGGATFLVMVFLQVCLAGSSSGFSGHSLASSRAFNQRLQNFKSRQSKIRWLLSFPSQLRFRSVIVNEILRLLSKHFPVDRERNERTRCSQYADKETALHHLWTASLLKVDQRHTLRWEAFPAWLSC